MTTEDLRTIMLRDLGALKRELGAYPDDETVWTVPAGVPNSAGTLALHLAGNLHHYVGAVLGGSGYVRDREEEFGARDLPRSELMARIDAASAAVDGALRELDENRLDEPFPADFPHGRVAAGRFLLHLATHLAYHLGQVDYHRRLVTGDATGVEAQSLKAIF
jgi:uncharacterized damage-inducible protein DinB